MKTTTITQVLLGVLAFGVLATSATAQTTQTVTVTSTVPQVLALSINTTSVSMPFAVGDFDTSTGAASITSAGATSLSVLANRGWTVSVKANTAAFGFTPSAGDADPAKPAGDLSFKLSSDSTYSALTVLDQSVETGTAGGTGKPGNSFDVDYQLDSNLNTNPPGSYALAVVYTLTAP